jgi:hypothetical protein
MTAARAMNPRPPVMPDWNWRCSNARATPPSPASKHPSTTAPKRTRPTGTAAACAERGSSPDARIQRPSHERPTSQTVAKIAATKTQVIGSTMTRRTGERVSKHEKPSTFGELALE